MSFEVILPFLRPIAHLIQDPDVTEIMVNGSRRIFVERQGLLEEVEGIQLDERNLKVAVKNIARALVEDVRAMRAVRLDSRRHRATCSAVSVGILLHTVQTV